MAAAPAMRGLRAATLLALACAASATIGQTISPPAAPVSATFDDEDAYALYALVLMGGFKGARAARQRLIEGDDCVRPSGPLAGKVLEADVERHRLGKLGLRLAERLPAGIGVAILDDADAKRAGDAIASEPDGNPYPGGLWSLSPVGFSIDREVAVVYVGRYCGLTCGTYESRAYAREGTGWRRLPGQIGCMAMSRAGN